MALMWDNFLWQVSFINEKEEWNKHSTLWDLACYWGWLQPFSFHYDLLTTIGKEALKPLQRVPIHAIMQEIHG